MLLPTSAMQRVGIVGSGAVGTFFGIRLAEAGHDVRFLLSSRHSSTLPTSFSVRSWQGDYVLESPKVARSPWDLGDDLDWVLVCLKGTALQESEGQVLDDLVGPIFERCQNTMRIQMLMNGLGAEEMAAARFGAHRVHGGLVYGGLTRDGVGEATHEGVPAEIRGGSFIDDPTEIQAAAALWEPALNVQYTPQPCLLKAQWAKLAWNIPFNGLTVDHGGVDVAHIWHAPDTRDVAVGLMREVIAAANADLAKAGKTEELDPDALVNTLSSITDKMAKAKYVPSTTMDFLHNRPMELNAIFCEPLRRAQALGVETPHLEALTTRLLNL